MITFHRLHLSVPDHKYALCGKKVKKETEHNEVLACVKCTRILVEQREKEVERLKTLFDAVPAIAFLYESTQ